DLLNILYLTPVGVLQIWKPTTSKIEMWGQWNDHQACGDIVREVTTNEPNGSTTQCQAGH
ncbi:hypothetical protein, partial [Vibrio ponticus]|uniref:hypothetical protein n=1 Tax=Vibrio ponticus TaxID=265668 RepID=UPI001C86697E